jgi:hypothetical protein
MSGWALRVIANKKAQHLGVNSIWAFLFIA